MCCEECFIGEKKKKKIQQRQAECVSGQDCPPQPAQPVLGIGAAWVHLPSACPPFVLQLRDPNPDWHPEAGAVRLNAQLGACKEPGEPLGLEQHKDCPIPSSPCRARSCCAGVELVAPRAKGAGQRCHRAVGRTGAPCRGRGHEEQCRGWELPASTLPHHHGGSLKPGWALGGGSKQGLPAWDRAQEGTQLIPGRSGGVGRELAPAASSWLIWLLQGPGPRAATPSFGQPRFLAWEVPAKLQRPPAARTPPAMGSAVPCP